MFFCVCVCGGKQIHEPPSSICTSPIVRSLITGKVILQPHSPPTAHCQAHQFCWGIRSLWAEHSLQAPSIQRSSTRWENTCLKSSLTVCHQVKLKPEDLQHLSSFACIFCMQKPETYWAQKEQSSTQSHHHHATLPFKGTGTSGSPGVWDLVIGYHSWPSENCSC